MKMLVVRVSLSELRIANRAIRIADTKMPTTGPPNNGEVNG